MFQHLCTRVNVHIPLYLVQHRDGGRNKAVFRLLCFASLDLKTLSLKCQAFCQKYEVLFGLYKLNRLSQ